MDVNEHERLSNITLIKVNEQLVVRKDMDVNEHERLSNITLIKVNERIVFHVHLHSFLVFEERSRIMSY
jgi:predicted metalloenzyme YecM